MAGIGGERIGAPMLDRLRSATREAHATLEDRLALMAPPLERARFVAVLQMFEAFHRAWEPRMAALLGERAADLVRPRRILAEEDLHALGAEVVPGPAFDLDAVADAASAWGSLYVVEGSALGGQVISKALRATDWAPEGGLAYFNPYGRETGLHWRGFCAGLEQAAAALDPERVVAGACATFAALSSNAPATLEQA